MTPAIACPDGTYANSATRKCESCPSSCSLCSSASVCSKCSSGYYLNEDECISHCPSGKYPAVDRFGYGTCNEPNIVSNSNAYYECLELEAALYALGLTTDTSVKDFDEMGKSFVCRGIPQCNTNLKLISPSCSWKRKFAIQCYPSNVP